MGVAPNGWMVYSMEHPIKKWMITGAIPILGNLQIDIVYTFIHIISTLKTGW
jgi:hypothetical protein